MTMMDELRCATHRGDAYRSALTKVIRYLADRDGALARVAVETRKAADDDVAGYYAEFVAKERPG